MSYIHFKQEDVDNHNVKRGRYDHYDEPGWVSCIDCDLKDCISEYGCCCGCCFCILVIVIIITLIYYCPDNVRDELNK